MALFEWLATDLPRERSVMRAAWLRRTTWDEVSGIKTWVVTGGLRRHTTDAITLLGVHEKAIAKWHRDLTGVADLDGSRVLYVAEDRKQSILDGGWATLSPAQRNGIEAIAMDMWEPYIQSTSVCLAEADTKIVFEKFHVAKHLHDTVDRVRRTKHRTLQQSGDRRLTWTKYLWLLPLKYMTAEQQAIFRLLRRRDLKVARVWTLKERFRKFWDDTSRGAKQNFFARWFWRATYRRLQPNATVAKLIQRHLSNLLTYLQHGMANAGLEAVNAIIQGVKKRARGFRHVKHCKTRSTSIVEVWISIQPPAKA